MKLIKGQKYEWWNLHQRGWTGPHKGYHYGYYFDYDTGEYLGPDQFGVEPLFEETDNETEMPELRRGIGPDNHGGAGLKD